MGIVLNCDHRAKTDLTGGLGEVRNWYCKTCGIHWYKGSEWSKKEWEEWVNSEEEDDMTAEDRKELDGLNEAWIKDSNGLTGEQILRASELARMLKMESHARANDKIGAP